MNELSTEVKNHHYDREEDSRFPEAGEYWKITLKGEENSLLSSFKYKQNDILLISMVNIVDGQIHSVEFAHHPKVKHLYQSDRKNTRLLIDDFLDCFIHVLKEEAEEDRQQDLQKINEEIKKLQEELSLGYVDPETNESAVAFIAASITLDNQGGSNLPITTQISIESIEEKTKKIQALAEKQSTFIQTKSTAISANAMLLSRYYAEKADCGVASLGKAMNVVTKLQKGVETIKLFNGDGVSITMLKDGKMADENEPISFYQRLLYLDQEFFYNMASGGAGFEDFENFTMALSINNELIERIAPSSRSVVLMQSRKHKKEYFTPEQWDKNPFGCLSEQAEKNELNAVKFLVVRNGERLFRIDSPAFQSVERLFPTEQEINDCYRSDRYSGRFGGTQEYDDLISYNDIKFIEARNKHDDKTTFYKRIILVLWGIHLKDNTVFGDFVMARNGKAWLSSSFQEQCQFIHDDEDALDFMGESINKYFQEQNDLIQAGSQIIFREKALDCDSFPKGVACGERHDYLFKKPVNGVSLGKSNGEFFIGTVKMKDGEFVVDVLSRNHRRYDSVPTNSEFYPTKANRGTWLVTDGLEPEKINYLFNSRKQREQYEQYGNLLLAAKVIAVKIENEQAQMFSELSLHIGAIYKEFDQKRIKDVFNSACRIYRAKRGAKEFPKKGDKEYKKALSGIGNIIQAILYPTQHVSAILNLTNKEFPECEPICLAINGGGDYVLTTKVPKNEQLVLNENAKEEIKEYPFYKRIELSFEKATLTVTKISIVSINKKHGSDLTIHQFQPYFSSDFSSIKFWNLNPNLHEAYCKQIEICNEGSKFIEALEKKEPLSKDIVEKIMRMYIAKNSPRKYSLPLQIAVPIACMLSSYSGKTHFEKEQQITARMFIYFVIVQDAQQLVFGRYDFADEEAQKDGSVARKFLRENGIRNYHGAPMEIRHADVFELKRMAWSFTTKGSSSQEMTGGTTNIPFEDWDTLYTGNWCRGNNYGVDNITCDISNSSYFFIGNIKRYEKNFFDKKSEKTFRNRGEFDALVNSNMHDSIQKQSKNDITMIHTTPWFNTVWDHLFEKTYSAALAEFSEQWTSGEEN